MPARFLVAFLLASVSAWGQGSGSVAVLANVAALTNRVPSTLNPVVSVSAYHAEGDWGAPRNFRYLPASTEPTDGGCNFATTTGVGRWHAGDCDDAELDIRWFGPTEGGVVDTTARIQAAIDATGYQQTLRIPTGTWLVSSNLIVTRPLRVTGDRLGSVLLVSASFPTNQAVVVVRPDAFYENGRLDNFSILPESGTPGGDGILLDFSATNAAWSGSTFENLFVRTLNGVAFRQINPNYDHDAFFTSSIRENTFDGGVELDGVGDSIRIQNNRVSTADGSTTNAYHGITVRQLLNSDPAGRGNAKLLLIADNNVTAHGGIMVKHAHQPRILGNNMELYQGPQAIWTNSALITLRGTSNDPVAGAVIEGNFLGPTANQVDNAIELVCARDTFIDHNDIPYNAGKVVLGVTNEFVGIRIHSNTWHTYVGPQRWPAYTWVGTGNRMLISAGHDTLRFRPRALVFPPFQSPVNWSNVMADAVVIRATNSSPFTIKAPSFDFIMQPLEVGQQLAITITNATSGNLGTVTWDPEYLLDGFESPPAGRQTTAYFYLDSNFSNWVQHAVSKPWSAGGTRFFIGTNEVVNPSFTNNAQIYWGIVGTNSITAEIVDGSIGTNEINAAFYTWVTGAGGGSYLPLSAGVSNALTGHLWRKKSSDIREPMWESGTAENAVGLRANAGKLTLSEFNTNDATVLETFITVDPTGDTGVANDVITIHNEGYDNEFVVEPPTTFLGPVTFNGAVTNLGDLTYGNVSVSNLTAVTVSGNASGLTNLNASNLASGTVSSNRLPLNLVPLAVVGSLGTNQFMRTRTGVLREQWIPAVSMSPGSDAPTPATNAWATATDGERWEGWDFSFTATNSVNWTFTLPKAWDGGTLSASLSWKQVAAEATSTNAWMVGGGSLTSGETGGNTLGTLVRVLSVGANDTNVLTVTAASSPFTIGGSPSAGHNTWFTIRRHPGDTNDSSGVLARLRGVHLQWLETTNEPPAL